MRTELPHSDRRTDSNTELLVHLGEHDCPLADVLGEYFPDDATVVVVTDGPRRAFFQEVKT
jgi:hypothetical protein